MTNTDEAKKNISPLKLSLLITIVDMKKSAYYQSLIRKHGSNLQLLTNGQGTADTEILDYFGILPSEKQVIFSIIREDRLNELLAALDDSFAKVKGGKGVAAAVPLTSVIGRLIYGFLSDDESMIKKN